MTYTVSHFIAGERFVDTKTVHHPIYNPAHGEIIGHVNFANDAICQQAILAAKNAFSSWSETTPTKRAQILFAFRALLEKHQQEIAKLVSMEHGKTLDDAKGSIARAIEIIEFHCGLLPQLQGTYSSNVSQGIDTYTLRQPVGVCVGISPFNFPVMVPIWMMIPAISCGNTFILKPSEQAPSAPIRLVELLHEAGLPPGVVNCVHGDKKTVETLITHHDIAAVTAVASTNVAKSIYTLATAHGKRAHTFGGAKNHAVIMPDADIKYTARALIGAAFGSAGERCMALSVAVVVGEQTAHHLLEELSPLIQQIHIDSYDATLCDMGPVISHAHLERIKAHIALGVEEGAQLIIDGRGFKHAKYPQGYFIGPCLFDHVTENMSIYQNEIFGPVLCIVRVHDLDEAIALVNRNQYGNGSAIFTKDGYQAREYSQRVQVGMVGVNIPIPVPIASHPFGGWKNSSFGDTNMHGSESIHFYTKRKTITSKWPATHGSENIFAMPNHRDS